MQLDIMYIHVYSSISLHQCLQCGLEPGEIGVITPLRQQQNLIRENLQHQHGKHLNLVSNDRVRARDVEWSHDQAEGSREGESLTMSSGSCLVEVNTVDKYQGRDKECIIVSCTRSNPKGNVSSLLSWSLHMVLIVLVVKEFLRKLAPL